MSGDGSSLANLRDIHLPDAVALWPPAPGWWIALGLIIAIAVWQTLRLRRRARSPERFAVNLLDEVEARYREDGDPVALCTELSRLIRRVALTRFEREEVASLHGEERARTLIQGASAEPIPVELIERLENVVYAGAAAPIEPDEPDAWIKATRRFIGRPS